MNWAVYYRNNLQVFAKTTCLNLSNWKATFSLIQNWICGIKLTFFYSSAKQTIAAFSHKNHPYNWNYENNFQLDPKAFESRNTSQQAIVLNGSAANYFLRAW